MDDLCEPFEAHAFAPQGEVWLPEYLFLILRRASPVSKDGVLFRPRVTPGVTHILWKHLFCHPGQGVSRDPGSPIIFRSSRCKSESPNVMKFRPHPEPVEGHRNKFLLLFYALEPPPLSNLSICSFMTII